MLGACERNGIKEIISAVRRVGFSRFCTWRTNDKNCRSKFCGEL